MPWFKRRSKLFLAGIVLLLLATFFFVAPEEVGKTLNPTAQHSHHQSAGTAALLHQRLVIADLHADSLLWDRDLLKKSEWGHVDVPRLIEGNVALQVFSVVTSFSIGSGIEKTEKKHDAITILAMMNRWPPACVFSLKERALYQAEKLRQAAADSSGSLRIIRTAADLAEFLEQRKKNGRLVAGLLSVEGAHALQGDLKNIDVFYDAGFRMMAPTHFFDNDIGGAASGAQKGGLTQKGREMVRIMQSKKMIVDLAHASPHVMDDVLKMATQPVVVSHTGVRGTCNNNRNLTDEQIRGVARSGGIIGIGYWEVAVCGTDANAIAKAIKYAVRVGGIEHVALGSDFDGAISAPFDTTGLDKITEALLKEGFSETEVRMIMGENVFRLFEALLPD